MRTSTWHRHFRHWHRHVASWHVPGSPNDDSPLQFAIFELVVIVEAARADDHHVAGLTRLLGTENAHLVDLQAEIVLRMGIRRHVVRAVVVVREQHAGAGGDDELRWRRHAVSADGDPEGVAGRRGLRWRPATSAAAGSQVVHSASIIETALKGWPTPPSLRPRLRPVSKLDSGRERKYSVPGLRVLARIEVAQTVRIAAIEDPLAELDTNGADDT